MSRIIFLLTALMVSGCYSDQRQAVAACRLNSEAAAKDVPDGAPGNRFLTSANRIQLCMEAKGYELLPTTCNAPTDDTGQSGVIIAADLFTVASTANCYAPFGWWGRQTLKFERWAGLDLS